MRAGGGSPRNIPEIGRTGHSGRKTHVEPHALKRATFDVIRRRTGAILFCFILTGVSLAGTPRTDTSAHEPDDGFAKWWNGKYLTGNWFGARDVLGANGLKLEGRWKGAYYGVLASKGGQRGFFDQELAFGALLNIGELVEAEPLDDLLAFAEARWRDPATNDDPNSVVEASNLFNPSPYESGVGWRFVQFGMKFTPDLFGTEDFLSLTAGWLRPYREFLVQPLSVNFLNTSIQLAKGLGGNIPFSSSFSSWGGVAEIKPVKWHYSKAGLFMSYPEATFSSNNGLMFQGYAPDTSQNGLYFMAETGFTPEIGPDKLPGKYAFGAYYYGEDNKVYGTAKYGFYWQADQMLFRERGAAAGSQAGTKPGLTAQGLHMFSMAAFAPPYNNRYPFYAQGGLVYEGLVPRRDKDQLMGAASLGQYANSPGRTYTMVLEGAYRINLNSWAYFQPDVQYLVRPDGSSQVPNAAIIGFFAGVSF